MYFFKNEKLEINNLVNYTNLGLEYQINIIMHEYNNHFIAL